MFIDESHVTLPQIRAMYGGDHSRKETLVEYGFRLPAASDNRPLTFEEFEAVTGQTVYVSATPADYELAKSEGLVVEQIVRPTGLLDPPIEVRPTKNQVDDLMEEIRAGNHPHQTHGGGTRQLLHQNRHPLPLHPLGRGYGGARRNH